MDRGCRFCQIALKRGPFYTLTAPDNTQSYFCLECASDILKYITSGEAEDRMMDRLQSDAGPINTPTSRTTNTLHTSLVQSFNNSIFDDGTLLVKPKIKKFDTEPF